MNTDMYSYVVEHKFPREVKTYTGVALNRLKTCRITNVAGRSLLKFVMSELRDNSQPTAEKGTEASILLLDFLLLIEFQLIEAEISFVIRIIR